MLVFRSDHPAQRRAWGALPSRRRRRTRDISFNKYCRRVRGEPCYSLLRRRRHSAVAAARRCRCRRRSRPTVWMPWYTGRSTNSGPSKVNIPPRLIRFKWLCRMPKSRPHHRCDWLGHCVVCTTSQSAATSMTTTTKSLLPLQPPNRRTDNGGRNNWPKLV